MLYFPWVFLHVRFISRGFSFRCALFPVGFFSRALYFPWVFLHVRFISRGVFLRVRFISRGFFFTCALFPVGFSFGCALFPEVFVKSANRLGHLVDADPHANDTGRGSVGGGKNSRNYPGIFQRNVRGADRQLIQRSLHNIYRKNGFLHHQVQRKGNPESKLHARVYKPVFGVLVGYQTTELASGFFQNFFPKIRFNIIQYNLRRN